MPEFSPLASPNIGTTNPWCAFDRSLLRMTALGTYVIPKADVQLGFTFRSDAGASLSASYVASPAATTLGRNFAGGSPTVTVNLIEPGTLYGDRVNQFDMRIGKLLRFGQYRANIGLDITNVLNSNPVLTYSEAFTTTWLRPSAVLQPRFLKLSAQFNF